jgi:uncharacterized protein YndB with AHSA1/START domain
MDTGIDPAVVPTLRDRWLRLERELDAPPDRVHRAWSDPEDLASWFCRQVQGSLLPGAPSTLVWSDRSIPVEVLESDPPGRFRFRWTRGTGTAVATEVTIVVEPRGYGSRVTLTDGPFDLTALGVADVYVDAAGTWGGALANLKSRVDYGTDLRRQLR